MLSIKNPLLQFGQIEKLSDTDILQLNSIYDCKCEYNVNLFCDLQCGNVVFGPLALGFFNPASRYRFWLNPAIQLHPEYFSRYRLVRVAVFRVMSVTCDFLFFIPNPGVNFKAIPHPASQNKQITLPPKYASAPRHENVCQPASIFTHSVSRQTYVGPLSVT